MKATIERATLLKCLGHVQSVVERRNTIPILSNVLITAQKGRLSLAATDMDLAITEQVEASAAKTGSTTAPMWNPFSYRFAGTWHAPYGLQFAGSAAESASHRGSSGRERRISITRWTP